MSKSIIIIIVIWLAIAGGIVFVIVPLAQESLGLGQTNLALEQQVAELESLTPQLEKLKSDYQAHLAQAEKVREALPAREEIPELISEVTSLSSKNGLYILGLGFSVGGQTTRLIGESAVDRLAQGERPLPTMSEGTKLSGAGLPSPSETASSRLVSIDLSLMGSYQSVKDFLEDAEKDLRILDLRSLSFSPGGTAGQGNGEGESLGLDVYSFNLVFETYFLPK